MLKSDASIRNICVAAIKRSTIKPYDFLFTRFFETDDFTSIDSSIQHRVTFDEKELPIAQTIINLDSWTLVTTRQIISCIDGIMNTISPDKVENWTYGDFKGYNNSPVTMGVLSSGDLKESQVFIETGRASMVNIHAIDVLVGLWQK